MDVELRLTSDGSHTLFVRELNESYHSVHGALQESRHVFIKSGLEHVALHKKSIRILEVGFGTGLNALLTIEAASIHALNVEYTTVEAFPLDLSVTSSLNYAQFFDHPSARKWFSDIHAVTWGTWHTITPGFKLHKLHQTVEQAQLAAATFDLVYFDAFGPEKQPEMWLPPTLEKVSSCLSDGGCLVTYCAKGQVKRDLRLVGLHVESLPGPPGKREMIRATRLRT